jgi:hypothetical protein
MKNFSCKKSQWTPKFERYCVKEWKFKKIYFESNCVKEWKFQKDLLEKQMIKYEAQELWKSRTLEKVKQK